MDVLFSPVLRIAEYLPEVIVEMSCLIILQREYVSILMPICQVHEDSLIPNIVAKSHVSIQLSAVEEISLVKF